MLKEKPFLDPKHAYEIEHYASSISKKATTTIVIGLLEENKHSPMQANRWLISVRAGDLYVVLPLGVGQADY